MHTGYDHNGPDSDPGFRVKVLEIFLVVPSSLGGGLADSSLTAKVVQLLRRNVKRFRGGLVLKARRLLYHSTLVSRVIKNVVHTGDDHSGAGGGVLLPPVATFGHSTTRLL